MARVRERRFTPGVKLLKQLSAFPSNAEVPIRGWYSCHKFLPGRGASISGGNVDRSYLCAI
jgi:hypothetical protein